jgi:hypothetical protein
MIMINGRKSRKTQTIKHEKHKKTQTIKHEQKHNIEITPTFDDIC